METPSIIPGQYTPRFAAAFGWYTRRLFAKKFHAVRMAAGSREAITRAAASEAPLVVVMNHSSWWDPLVCVLLGRALFPERSACAPIDAAMLAKFSMFKKLGLFGINPDDPRAMPAVVEHVLERLAKDQKPTFWVTPQGRFHDVRDAIAIRPGVAAILARSPNAVAVSLAIEYAFWLEQKPEVFLRVEAIDRPAKPSTPHWHAAVEGAMARNAAALAALVRAREPSGFEPLVASASTINPAMDLWLRLRGKSAGLEDRTRVQRSAHA